VVLVRQFLIFAIGGVIGFVIDSTVLLLLLQWTSAGPYLGRLISYLSAASVTWAFHRAFTFRSSARSRKFAQGVSFLLANAFGGLINLGVYVLLVAESPWIGQRPVIAVAAGSVCGLAFNFIASRVFVFRNASARQPHR
jgi:putative flippase GtrA